MKNTEFLKKLLLKLKGFSLCCISFLMLGSNAQATLLYYATENNLTTNFDFVSNFDGLTSTPFKSNEILKNTSETHTETPNSRAASAASANLMEPTIGYEFQCICKENPIGSGGNATTTENGQYNDFITITSNSGETWTVVSSDGFYAVSSPQPPSSPTTLTPGTLLTETFAGSGVYQIMGVHIESLGYTISFTNGTDTLTAEVLEGQCAYPNPSFIDLRAGYCLTSEIVNLETDNDGLIGTGVFDILQEDGVTMLMPNATTFNPAALGAGNYVVRYTFLEDGGCGQAITQAVSVAAAPTGAMSCNDNVQISLADNCATEITADMVLEGTYDNEDIFDIQISFGNTPINNPVTDQYAGEALMVSVIDFCSGNSCMGSVILEDKMAPLFDCPAEPIIIDCSVNVSSIDAPVATDNCEGVVASQLISQNVEEFSCDDANGLLRQITKEYTAFDTKGNQANTNCIQTIQIERGDLINVVFPADALYDCGTMADLSPNNTGRPTLNGTPIISNSICNFLVFHNDDTLNICSGIKIIRNWTVLDWCNTSSTPGNTILGEQIIKVQDISAPIMTCPDAFIVSTTEEDCTATFELPTATVTDNCSANITQNVFSTNGFVNDGIITGLQLGTATLNYTATDECGNAANCSTTLEVVDATSPTMVCDEITTVTLSSTSEAQVAAEEFDDGSHDDCFSVTFDVRRMDGDGTYAPTVLFDCSDPNNNPILVELRATDFFGNANSCMVQVNVVDSGAPFLDCGINEITIDCEQDFEDYFTLPTIEETCGIFPLQQVTTNTINSCGEGVAIRTYTATDANGNSASCSQTITIENTDFLQLVDILFPEDYGSAICGTTIESLEPDSLPLVNSRPIIDYPACSQIAVSKNDEYFTTDGSCLNIRRTWTVVNWCDYDPEDANPTGIFTHVQEINVTDNEAPYLICPPNPFVKIINPVCDTTVFALGPDTLLDCSQNIQLSSTLQKIPVTDSDNMLMTSDGLGPYEDLLPGEYQVYLTADDGCGNTSTCGYILQVADNKAPTPYCYQSLVISLMETGMIEFSAEEFNIESVDNCTPQEDLLYSYSVNPNDAVRTFTCDDIGENELEMYVTDEGFNSSACSVILVIQDNMGGCTGNLNTIAGLIHTEDDVNVANVNVGVNGGLVNSLTNTEGQYSLAVETGGDYTFYPEKNTNIKNGVSTFDVLLIRQHILGNSNLDSPYKLIAADVNNSGSITMSDVVTLKSLILELTTELPNNNTSWRFVDASYEFPNPQNPWESGFPEFINYNNLNSHITDADFIAIKIGDLNGSVSGADFNGSSEERSANPFLINTDDSVLKVGETQTVWFEANDHLDKLGGLQTTITFDINTLEFTNIEATQSIELSDFNTNKSPEGLLNLSWENAAFDKEELRFGLTFKVKETATVSEAIKLSNDLIKSEAYYQNANYWQVEGVQLAFNESLSNAIVLHQNTPNPFRAETTIAFELPTANEINLTIYDVSGRLVYSQSSKYDAGLQKVNINKADLSNNTGMFFYRIETDDFTAVKRMMLND